MKKLLNLALNLFPSTPVYAHCDIPCGIYDPKSAQLAAKTVLTMVQKLKEIKAEPGSEEELQARNSFVRMVSVKEDHAEICKKEILILWTDYFKTEHLEKFPDLHETIWKTTKLCSENKRHIDEDLANQLVKAVDKIAEIFTSTKA